MMGRTEQGLKNRAIANARYDKDNTRSIKFKFNLKTDADILAKLDSIDNKQGYIKQLIREDIARNAAGSF